MRIPVTVQTLNRRVEGGNKKRPEKSNLSVGYVTPQKDIMYILHQTLTNTVGVRYKINHNVSHIFDKFLNQGKVTIRIEEPPFDLIIHGDPNKVTVFIKMIKAILRHENHKNMLNLTNLTSVPNKIIKTTTKFVLKGKTQIPPLPSTLKSLTLAGCSMNGFLTRILRLQNLKILNLENNSLESIPVEINLLPDLQVLELANNKLGYKSNFAWLRCKSLQEKLISLDLRENHLRMIPGEICRLKKMEQLLLDKNKIMRLPSAIGRLPNLKILSVANNELSWLPGTFRHKRFHSLDVSCNSWLTQPTYKFQKRPLTLLDLAATAVVSACQEKKKKAVKLDYSEETLPRILVEYLDYAGSCICGCPTFPEKPDVFYPAHRHSKSLVCEVGESPQICLTLCDRDIPCNSLLVVIQVLA